ncbi:MAG: CbtA family protein [Alphaproteobacteria bacterium]|nr:CbtA family protein [Alphaproteobacteria bacterium]
MFRQIFFAGIIAGCLAGIVISVVQAFTTTPIILHAETFEGGGPAHDAALTPGHAPFMLAVMAADRAPEILLAHSDDAEEGAAWTPVDGLERTAYTVLANVILGVGLALLLVGCYALHGQPVDGRRGVLWGLAGFAVFTLAPSLGLPPEVPGLMAAEVSARQLWWAFAAGGAALGLWLMIFGKTRVMAAAGILAMALPHVVGAPHPAEIGGAVPAELAGHFAATSIAVSAVFWAMLGWFSGALYQRFGESAA